MAYEKPCAMEYEMVYDLETVYVKACGLPCGLEYEKDSVCD
jgi:hypothetical protein